MERIVLSTVNVNTEASILEKKRVYTVDICDPDRPFQITTTVTKDKDSVIQWLNETIEKVNTVPGILYVGFAVHTDGRFKPTDVTLCVKDRCLVYRISKAAKNSIPIEGLKNLILHQSIMLVGQNVRTDLYCLISNTEGLDSCGCVEMKDLNKVVMRNVELKELVAEVFGKTLKMPKIGDWDKGRGGLSAENAQYAAVQTYYYWLLADENLRPRPVFDRNVEGAGTSRPDPPADVGSKGGPTGIGGSGDV